MWQELMRVWPRPFAAKLTNPAGSLVAHAGVADMAESMYDQLRPYLDQAADVAMPVSFSGHSLGGAMAKLIMVLTRLHNKRYDVNCAEVPHAVIQHCTNSLTEGQVALRSACWCMPACAGIRLM